MYDIYAFIQGDLEHTFDPPLPATVGYTPEEEAGRLGSVLVFGLVERAACSGEMGRLPRVL